MNGDGRPDLVVGAPGPFKDADMQPRPGCEAPPIPEAFGRAFVFTGNDPATWDPDLDPPPDPPGQPYSLRAALTHPDAPLTPDCVNRPEGPMDRFGSGFASLHRGHADGATVPAPQLIQPPAPDMSNPGKA